MAPRSSRRPLIERLKDMLHAAEPTVEPQIVGYIGYWLMAGEAHISTIAVRPDRRGRAYGELLLAHSLDDAANRGAHVATLEVRVSNHSAQQLYLKYGFDKVGLRKAYYSDNNEDAYIMTTPPLGSPQFQSQLERLKSALVTRLREPRMSAIPRPV
jgi:ribosomal-protein-alanine N-acetyltransferase